MQLHISPSLRHVTVLSPKGVKDLMKVKVGSRRISYRILFYSLLFFTLFLRFLFMLTAVETVNGEIKCSTIGCVGERLRPRILGKRLEPSVPEVVYRILEEPLGKDEIQKLSNVPQSLEEFMAEMKNAGTGAVAFALKLRDMVSLLEERTRSAKIHEYFYRHIASNAIPKHLHCLTLCLAVEHSTNSGARLHLPSPELVPSLLDNSLHHFVFASDNVLAASVVAASIVRNSLRPASIVIHLITDRKTYAPMQAWFSLHPISRPAVMEIKGMHHFDWILKGKIPVVEAMEKDRSGRSGFGGGEFKIVGDGDGSENPKIVAAKLQALSPKYNSMMNHIRIHLPELFPSLKKVVFLDDDVVVQTDLSPLWDIDLKGKVNGAVETCRGSDEFVMSKRLKSYLNFSHPLIAQNFDPKKCAWAYGMNIFDLEAWRRSNITQTYHYWVDQNLKSDLSLWQLGTLPPALIAFEGQVQAIDPFWHMLGLGYQEKTNIGVAKKAGVVHFNGRAKPWLEIGFPHLRPLWTKYIDFSDKLIRSCHIRAP